LFRESPAVDKENGVFIVDHFDLGLVGKEASGHEYPDPAPTKPGDDARYLIGSDPRIRQDTLGLAEHDKWRAGTWDSDVETGDEVDATVAGRTGQPTCSVVSA
jgi:hypothetical protein